MDYAFAAVALDRCVERRDRDDELGHSCCAAASGWLFVRTDGSAPVTADGQLALVAGDCIGSLPADWVYLGRLGQRELFAAPAPEPAPTDADSNLSWRDLRSAAASLDAGQAGVLAYARALCAWRVRHRYCGECGGRNRAESGGHRLRCPSCGAVSFPRTDPAIIVAVRDGQRCLLGRQAGWPAGRYSTLAGFVEPGETLDAAVAREVREEAGVELGDCRYLGSQPWPFPVSLMLGFEAKAASTQIRLGDELEDARWFDPDEFARALADGSLLPPPRLSISRWLIQRWHLDVTGRPLPERRGNTNPSA
jgi:NAD+ diphosphatase